MNRLLIVNDAGQGECPLQAILKSEGFEVAVAANGREALELARQSPPEVVVTDVVLPVMDGFALCGEWMRDEQLRGIPLVFYSATCTEPQDRDHALELGAARFVAEPLEDGNFGRLLREVMAERRTGAGVPPRPAGAAPCACLQPYNRELVRRLERRVRDLAAANRALERESAARRRAEAEQDRLVQQDKMAAVSRIAGGVAHAFNNQMHSILGFCEVLRTDRAESDPGQSDLAEIQRAARRAADLTRQLLIFSGRQSIDPAPLDLNTLVLGVQDSLRALFGEEIRIVADLATDLPAMRGDPRQIRQVVLNMAENARDAMPRGGRLTIGTANVTFDEQDTMLVPEARRGKFVCLSVADTGVGMSEGVRAHVFEPFFSTKGPGRGAGLGLSVVYGIVRRHHGWMRVHSQPGLGSTFKVYLPADEAAAATGAPAEAGAQPLSVRGCGERVLLLEDDPEVRNLAARILRSRGYLVVPAGNVAEARTIFEREGGRFDLVFSDVVLPDGNGIDFCEELSGRRPGTAVLICSGYTGESARWGPIAQKKFRFLQKPYPMAVLLRMVREALDHRVSA